MIVAPNRHPATDDTARRPAGSAVDTGQAGPRRPLMGVIDASALSWRARGKAARAMGITKQSLLRLSVARQWSEARYATRLTRHLGDLPSIDLERRDIVDTLSRKCVATRILSVPDAVLDAADRFVARLRQDDSPNSSSHVRPRDLAADPAVFLWGLAPEHLDVAERYIGLPVRYLGVAIKKERPDEPHPAVRSIRRWHLDVEDRRMLKIIVYLSDVDDGCGPFEYLDRAQTERTVRALNYRSGFVLDTLIEQITPADDWTRVTGPRLSAVYVDTCAVLHRARTPTTSDRFSMTFVYSSRTPHQAFPEFMLSRMALRRLSHQLTPRQRRAVMID